jgi:hypothetical protein
MVPLLTQLAMDCRFCNNINTLWASISSIMSSVPYPPPEKASPDEIGDILAKLEVLLTDLPSQLRLQIWHFSRIGDDATLGEQLEHAFGLAVAYNWSLETTIFRLSNAAGKLSALCIQY